MNRRNKKIILTSIFFSFFILGTILIFITPLSVKATYGLTTKTIDGETITFNVFEPKGGDSKKKAIIIAHGAMASKEFLKGYAIELANAGFVAIPFDFRGHGQSTGELKLDNLIYDVKAIKDYLKNRGDIDMDNLGIIAYSMGGYPACEIVKKDKDFKCFIGIGTGLPNKDYYPEFVVKANDLTHPLNVLLILGRFDEGISLKRAKEGMALRLDMDADDIDTNKMYGSFQEGNASMIYLDDNSDHLTLCWDDTFIRVARDWVINTFPDVKIVDENFYTNIRTFILVFQVIGGLGFFFLIIEPLSNLILKSEKDKFHKIELQDESINSILKKIIFYCLIVGILGLLIMSPILIFLPLTLAGLMVVILFGAAFGLMIFLWKMEKKRDISLKICLKEPFRESRAVILKHIILGTILALSLYVILYLSFGLNYIGMAPSLFKIIWIPIYFGITFFIFIVFGLIFQMILQSKLEKEKVNRFKIAALIFGIQVGYICTIILVPSLVAGTLFPVILLIVIIPLDLLLVFVSIVLYQKTGNILAGAIINTFIIVCIICTLAPFIFVLKAPIEILNM
ncbi:MAG: alpha/beta hydrolase [Promethearchaeota archaeon]